MRRASSVSDWRPAARAALEESRARLLALTRELPADILQRQHSPLMSPPIWDVAHIANYEEQWLVRALGGDPLTDRDFDSLYDAFLQPRKTRAQLPILPPADAYAYASRVREQVLERLQSADPENPEPLLRHGFVYGMVAQHEQQHIETLLATLQLVQEPGRLVVGAPLPVVAPYQGPAELLVPGGTFVMGTDFPWALDNERPAHERTALPFHIDATLVTNGAYVEFIADGGYTRPELWTSTGWSHVQTARLVAPLFWEKDPSVPHGWKRRRFGETEPVPLTQPVQHVCWYEADAFARWAGKRLPTETEWERAAAGASVEHANLNGVFTQPVPAPAEPSSASTWGLRQTLGDVWEWTSSDFSPYPGFTPYPYREYSEVFFGSDYKVLRGGAWGVAPVAVRTTFRNWDYPIRRQIFSGFRCARDA